LLKFCGLSPFRNFLRLPSQIRSTYQRVRKHEPDGFSHRLRKSPFLWDELFAFRNLPTASGHASRLKMFRASPRPKERSPNSWRSAHDRGASGPRACAHSARSWTLSAALLSMCVRRYTGRLWHSWARRRHGAMLVTLLGAVRRPSGDLTTKNNQSRYHENNY